MPATARRYVPTEDDRPDIPRRSAPLRMSRSVTIVVLLVVAGILVSLYYAAHSTGWL